MWQIAFVTVGHLLILALALLGLRFLHRYTASSFLHCGVHCPTLQKGEVLSIRPV